MFYVRIGTCADACKIEHDISEETYKKLEELFKKL
ncbi:MAG: hypothetical protein IJ300_08940 [Clostridia bacterium]|nr:hypothetical protein [Clostridia bacterium]